MRGDFDKDELPDDDETRLKRAYARLHAEYSVSRGPTAPDARTTATLRKLLNDKSTPRKVKNRIYGELLRRRRTR